MPNASEPKRLLTRRSILIGAGALLLCAPAIVRAASIMPVRRLIVPVERPYAGFVDRLKYQALNNDLKSGIVRTVVNGEVVTEAYARRAVAYARQHGWIKD